MSGRIIVGDVEGRKLKRKKDETSTMGTNLELSLSQSLRNNSMANESLSMFPFNSSKRCEESSFSLKYVESSNDQVIQQQQPEFSCKYCPRKFSSYQALGGHQNAHRRERSLSRMGKEFEMGNFRHLYPHLAMGNHLPFHGSPLCHGAHMHPLAHMPAMSVPHFGPGYGNQGMQNTSLMRNPFLFSNPTGASVETPQRFNHRSGGFSCELNLFPTLPGDMANKATMDRDAFGGLMGNNFTGKQ